MVDIQAAKMAEQRAGKTVEMMVFLQASLWVDERVCASAAKLAWSKDFFWAASMGKMMEECTVGKSVEQMGAKVAALQEELLEYTKGCEMVATMAAVKAGWTVDCLKIKYREREIERDDFTNNIEQNLTLKAY